MLATSGGLLDAAVYLLHGHVFANAMTGNLVLLAVALMAHDFHQALRHVTPLVAFVLGSLVANYLLRFHAASALRLALLIEMAGLAVAGALPLQFPSAVVVGLVALTASLQITAFRRLGNVAYNTTFITGNLRSVFHGLFQVIFPAGPRGEMRQSGWRKFRDVGLICLGFLAGALLGGLCAPRLHNRSLWVADLLLLAAGWLLRGMMRSTSAGDKGLPGI